MPSPTLTSLLGRTIRGTVGEPWDFESGAGANQISGVVEDVSPEPSDPEWMLCSIKPFSRNGRDVTHVLVVARYPKTERLVGVCAEKRVGVHFVYDPVAGCLEASRVGEILSAEELPFLVGSIQLA